MPKRFEELRRRLRERDPDADEQVDTFRREMERELDGGDAIADP